MKAMLLAAAGAVAALATYAVPAAAEDGSARARHARGFAGQPALTCSMMRSSRHDGSHQMRGDGCRSDVVMDWYGGEWALYNNRTWKADSYNDWWHDRPDRAYPAWMRNNRDCSRMWFAGDTLRC